MSLSYTSFGIASGYEFAYRHQTYNVLTLLALCVTSYTTARSDEWWIAYPITLYLSLTCTVVGMLVRAWGTASGVGAGGLSEEEIFSPTQRASALVTTGAYGVVRHPLYLGSAFLIVSFGWLMNAWGLLTLCALHGVRMARLMHYEDAQLSAQFGTAWRTYRDATPNVLFPGANDTARLLAAVTSKPVSEWAYGLKANAVKLLPLIAIAVGGWYWPTGTYVWAVLLILSALDALELVAIKVVSAKPAATATATAKAGGAGGTAGPRPSSTPTPANSAASDASGAALDTDEPADATAAAKKHPKKAE